MRRDQSSRVGVRSGTDVGDSQDASISLGRLGLGGVMNMQVNIQKFI